MPIAPGTTMLIVAFSKVFQFVQTIQPRLILKAAAARAGPGWPGTSAPRPGTICNEKDETTLDGNDNLVYLLARA